MIYILLEFNAIVTAKVMQLVTDLCVSWLYHISTDTTFLPKSQTTFLACIRNVTRKITVKKSLPQSGIGLHKSSSSVSIINETSNNDLLKVEEWYRHNNMVLNPSKTTWILIGSKYKFKNCASLNLKIRQEKVVSVASQKLLCVHIDNTLLWMVHVEKVCAKLSSQLYLLGRINSYLSIEMRQLFYNAYITPYFDYGCIIWSHCKSLLVQRITKIKIDLEKKFIRKLVMI